ncbi:hypothetical protein B296_00042894, partial [Ensete ventricosum]
ALQASVPAGGCRPFGLAVAVRARRRCPCRLPLPAVAPASGIATTGCCPFERHRPPLTLIVTVYL